MTSPPARARSASPSIPPHASSLGAPIEGGIYKCTLEPVEQAVTEGAYAPWSLSDLQMQRLRQIFPEGVCDYSKPDQARPL